MAISRKMKRWAEWMRRLAAPLRRRRDQLGTTYGNNDRCALRLRVSTDDQTTESQRMALEAEAQRRECSVVLVWSLDRLTRQGVSATLEAVNRLVKARCRVVSLQKPWLETGGELTDWPLAQK